MSQINGKADIDKIYAQLRLQEEKIYQFVMLYSALVNKEKDYGTGQVIRRAEVHTLTAIESEPGITVSDLSKRWQRTKSAVSQNIKKLEGKGLIYKVRDTNDAKILHLYPTEEGVRLSTAHKLYDNIMLMQGQNEMLKTCTIQEIDTFFKVLDAYLNTLK